MLIDMYFLNKAKEDKKEIINIGWQKSNLEDIKQAVQNNDCIIISGTKEFIEKINKLLCVAIIVSVFIKVKQNVHNIYEKIL